MENLLIIALCVAAISFTISTTSMFKWLRELVSPIHYKIEELIHCPYCLSHWITFIILLIVPNHILKIWESQGIIVNIFNYLFTSFSVIGIVGMIHYILLRSYEPVAKAMMYRHKEKVQSEREQQQN